jgi:dihydrodipicolinate synthase/N-acetylneuraminate lyase
MRDYPQPAAWVLEWLREGQVIPAHPLALTRGRKLDERRQRALTRYYHAAGAGGIAVGVHTTQFEIRDPRYGLFQSVLKLAAETVKACDAASGRQTVRIAGICGRTRQAVSEAGFALGCGYHAGLLSLAALKGTDEEGLITHCRKVAREIPVVGFYLQPSVGGRELSVRFWRRFVEIPNVVAIKAAPFNRYHTLDVVRAVAESGRAAEIALYTGNDDNIVPDLLTRYAVATPRGAVRLHFAGGLLGHWAFWTRRAVELLNACQRARSHRTLAASLLTLGAQVTEANAAIFDAANGFAGCIPGSHEILRRQGLMENVHCLNPREVLSPGQLAEINRVCAYYPELNDDAFVRENLTDWLK